MGLKSIGNDQELAALAQEIPIDEVAETIRESLPVE